MIKLTRENVFDQLKKVMDPELGVDIVSLGLVYEVTVAPVQTPQGEAPFVHVLLTLTTPGCPLAGMFETLIKDALSEIPQLDTKNVELEITFDPPWVPDMMSPAAKAELGFD